MKPGISFSSPENLAKITQPEWASKLLPENPVKCLQGKLLLTNLGNPVCQKQNWVTEFTQVENHFVFY
jgi:hypothetical protein